MSRYAAVVLSAGTGSRMKSDVPKQYLPLCGKPVIYYSLKAFQESAVDEIVLVAGADDIEYCKTEIVEKFHFDKVTRIVQGGDERYDSVYAGLAALGDVDYVMIHDGARPLVSADMIARSAGCVAEEGACTVGMPAKDTIKIAGADGYVADTPDRRYLWQIQTPQSFSYPKIMEAYRLLHQKRQAGERTAVTDDAMLVEQMLGMRVRLLEGSYKNIKITTPEDLAVAEIFLGRKDL